MNYKLQITDYLKKYGFAALRPKAVLFDMDGVLYDSMPNHAVAWQKSMASFGIDMTADDAYTTEGQRGSDTIRQLVRQQKGTDIDEEEADLMYKEKARLFHLMPEAPVMPGILSLMAQIKECGLKIGVVTGSGQRLLIDRLNHDFGAYIDDITTAYDVTKGKPDPQPYQIGMQKAGCQNPWEALVVENAPLGVRAGVAARIFTIAVNTGPLPDSRLLQEGANLIFSKMTDLSESWPHLLQEANQHE